MSEVAGQTFRTKTGTCTVTPERIVLTRAGRRGAAAERIAGGSVVRILVVYGAIGAAALALGASMLVAGDTLGALFCLVGVLLLWNVVASRYNSAAPVVERSKIRSAEVHSPRPPFARGYFAVRFEEGGRIRKRLIMLPGSLDGGNAEYAKALAILRDAGLVSGK